MSRVLFANNDETTLAFSISNVATTATLASGTGALFPSPTGDQYFTLTLSNASATIWEIVNVTARSGDVVTIVRAQEGTSALAWNAGDLARGLLTAASLRNIQLLNVPRVYNVPGTYTYTPSTGTKYVVVEAVGAGGGGGGAQASGMGNACAGTSGNAGAYGRSIYYADFSGVTIVIGTRGFGGAGAAGSAGGATSFGTPSPLTCPGGPAGQAGLVQSGSASGGNGVTSGLPTGANLLGAEGGVGGPSFGFTVGQVSYAAPGGASFYGGGGNGQQANLNGQPASSPGSGGGGTIGIDNTLPLTGGEGADGYMLIWEF